MGTLDSPKESLGILDWEPHPADQTIELWQLTGMGIPASSWESQASCPQTRRGTPTSPQETPLKMYLSSFYSCSLRTWALTRSTFRGWTVVGGDEGEKFSPDFGKKNQFRSAFPGKEQRPKSPGGKSSWRGVQRARRWITMSKLLALSFRLLFLWGWERGIDLWQDSQRQAQMFNTLSLHPQAALRTWYLGQQPGAQHCLKCVILFSLQVKEQ